MDSLTLEVGPPEKKQYDLKAMRARYLIARACAVRAFPYLEQMIVAMGYAVDERITTPDQLIQNVETGEVFLRKGSPTMAVTDKAQVLVHPEFMERLVSCGGTAALGFVIAHEAFHVLMNHSKRKVRLAEARPNFRPDLAGIACDLSINPSLKANADASKGAQSFKITPPTGECTGVFPADFGLPDGLTFEGYYSRLLQKDEEDQKNGKKGPKGSGLPGAGCLPQPDDSLSDGAKKVSEDPNTGGWSENRVQQMVQAAARAAKDHETQNRGSVPAGMLLELEDAIAPPKIAWTEQFRQLLSHAEEHRPGAEDSVWHKPSRRQAGVGYGAGSPRLPGCVEYVPKVGVVLDTSGSMGGVLGNAVSEVIGIINATGGEVVAIYCDTEAHDGGMARGLNDIASQIRGGGGTDMTAALDMAQKKRCDVVVCVTDGDIGRFGGNRGYPLIWCITPGGSVSDIQGSVDDGWASVLHIDEPDK